MAKKRRVCFPITSRAYYGRSRLLIRKLHTHPAIDLQLMLGGTILLDKYSSHIAEDIERGGFTISTSYFNVIEGGNHVAMAKTACLTALEFTNGFHSIDPDIVVICGDRFEQLAIAMAAAYLNKTIAHIEGGDVTGNIDESVRHAITKLAHLHFVTNADAGTGEMSDSLRHFREPDAAMTDQIRFITNVPVDEFIALLKRTACLVGNSSAGIKECSYLGTPVVNIGARQQGRLNAEHVVHTGYDAGEIVGAVRAQLRRGRYEPSNIYYRPGASETIVDRLASIELYTQKRFCDPVPAGMRTT